MTALLAHYGPLMRYIIAPILPNTENREECLSDIAMRIWKNVEQFDRQKGRWNAWLTAIAKNTALNHTRNNSRHNSIAEIPANTVSPEPSPEKMALRHERQLAVKYAIQLLSSNEQELFYRRYYYQKSMNIDFDYLLSFNRI